MSEKIPYFLGDSERPIRNVLEEIDLLFADGYRINRNFILEKIRKLAAFDNFLPYFLEQAALAPQLVNMIGAQCYLLHSGEHYYARLNFWLPKLTSADVIRARVEQYFSIGVLHNHSFDFFTVGVLGNGYFSQFYASQDRSIEHFEVGDRVPLVPTMALQLEKGMAIFVTKSYDFHIQFEPIEFSISLNLIPKIFDDQGSKGNAQLIVNAKTFVVERKFLTDPQAASRDELTLA